MSLSPESFIVGGWSEPGDEPHTVESDHVFIGYITWFNIKKRQRFSSPNEVSLRFEVTNGTSAVAECEVMKCGFTLIYEPEEAESTTWEATPPMEDSRHGQRSSFRTDEEHDYCYSDNSYATATTADSKRLNSLFSFFWKNALICKIYIAANFFGFKSKTSRLVIQNIQNVLFYSFLLFFSNYFLFIITFGNFIYKSF